MLKRLLKLKIKNIEGVTNLVFIKPITYAVEQKLRIVYAQTYRALVERQVATKSAMLDLLKKEGVWTDKEDDKFNELVVQISLQETLLETISKDNLDKQREAVVKLAKLRNELLELLQIKTEPMEFVAETIADEIKTENFLVESTFYEDGKPYFSSYEDFKTRRYNDDVVKIYDTFIKAININNTKTMLNFPENKWLLEHGYMDKSGNITDDELWKELELSTEEITPVAIIQEIKQEEAK